MAIVTKKLNEQKKRRAARIRTRIRGTAERPRLTVFRSNQFIYVQIIDDASGKTIISASTRSAKGKAAKKTEHAFKLGETVGEKAKSAGVKNVVFDKGRYSYHGRIKAVAEGARKSGLNF